MGTLGVAPISPPSSSPPGCEVGHLRPLVNFQIHKKIPTEILFSSLIVGDVFWIYFKVLSISWVLVSTDMFLGILLISDLIAICFSGVPSEPSNCVEQPTMVMVVMMMMTMMMVVTMMMTMNVTMMAMTIVMKMVMMMIDLLSGDDFGEGTFGCLPHLSNRINYQQRCEDI